MPHNLTLQEMGQPKIGSEFVLAVARRIVFRLHCDGVIMKPIYRLAQFRGYEVLSEAKRTVLAHEADGTEFAIPALSYWT